MKGLKVNRSDVIIKKLKQEIFYLLDQQIASLDKRNKTLYGNINITKIYRK